MTPDELTRLREEVARLTRERDAAEAIIGAHRWSRSGIQAELARLRAAIAPTEANVEALAAVMWETVRWRAQAINYDDPLKPWVDVSAEGRSPALADARLFLETVRARAGVYDAAINERAKL